MKNKLIEKQIINNSEVLKVRLDIEFQISISITTIVISEIN